ncbi:MAG: hypothetical protein M1819_005319 [Sarea resinae]|nr:MAG: hypothetical protein M1819_005319 [Sarea resinae]
MAFDFDPDAYERHAAKLGRLCFRFDEERTKRRTATKDDIDAFVGLLRHTCAWGVCRYEYAGRNRRTIDFYRNVKHHIVRQHLRPLRRLQAGSLPRGPRPAADEPIEDAELLQWWRQEQRRWIIVDRYSGDFPAQGGSQVRIENQAVLGNYLTAQGQPATGGVHTWNIAIRATPATASFAFADPTPLPADREFASFAPLGEALQEPRPVNILVRGLNGQPVSCCLFTSVGLFKLQSTRHRQYQSLANILEPKRRIGSINLPVSFRISVFAMFPTIQNEYGSATESKIVQAVYKTGKIESDGSKEIASLKNQLAQNQAQLAEKQTLLDKQKTFLTDLFTEGNTFLSAVNAIMQTPGMDHGSIATTLSIPFDRAQATRDTYGMDMAECIEDGDKLLLEEKARLALAGTDEHGELETQGHSDERRELI